MELLIRPAKRLQDGGARKLVIVDEKALSWEMTETREKYGGSPDVTGQGILDGLKGKIGKNGEIVLSGENTIFEYLSRNREHRQRD